MGPDKRDGGPAQGRRIPVPPTLAPADKAQQLLQAKSGIPSPRRRSVSGGGNSRAKDGTSAAILSGLTTAANKRPSQAPVASKIGKPFSRPNSSQSCDDKDDVRQRDNGQKDGGKRDNLQRDRAARDLAPRRPAPTAEATNLTDAGRRLLLKNSAAATCPVGSPNGKPAQPAAPPAGSKPLPRSVSTCRDRASMDTRSSMMRRSMSVGKGRILVNQTEQLPQQAGAKMRPSAARVSSASIAGAPYRQSVDKRDTSIGRTRPLSASAKSDISLSASVKSTLTTITEAPARPAAPAAAAAATTTSTVTQPKPAVPMRPVFSLNLAAIKAQQAAASVQPDPPVEQCASPTPADLGPPVPKLDLGGILQRRAEEQAAEPVFVVANEDAPEASGSSAHAAQADKRKSGSRQPSAKEEPAEHFYLYPKVNPQEKKRIDDICRVVPKRQQAAITDLFGKMVEARQNCEQMCFRGHRLLDQAQAEFKNRLAQKEEEVAAKSEEAAQWRQEAEFLRTQLAMLLAGRQPEEYSEDAAAQVAQNQTTGGEEEHAAYLRSSLLSAFDSMMQGAAGSQGGQGMGEAYIHESQGNADG